MTDVTKKHRSHVTGSEIKSRGWSRIPSPAVQRETKKQEVGIDYMSNYVSISDCSGSTSSFTAGDSTSWNTTGTAYYPYQTWGSEWGDSTWSPAYVPCPNTAIIERINDKEVIMDKRTLFAVYVVDPRKNGKILMDGKRVIAVNENQAMLKAGVAEVADAEGLDLEQVDVYVDVIGTFIRPRKETQKVKVVKEDE